MAEELAAAAAVSWPDLSGCVGTVDTDNDSAGVSAGSGWTVIGSSFCTMIGGFLGPRGIRKNTAVSAARIKPKTMRYALVREELSPYNSDGLRANLGAGGCF